MKRFEVNKCRLCGTTFCCITCRIRHEISEHQVNPNCDVCIYGSIVIRAETDPDLLAHVKAEHLPLHCVKCRVVFVTIEEFWEHKTCAGSSITPRSSLNVCPMTTLHSMSHTPSFFITPHEKKNGPAKNKLQAFHKTTAATSTPLPFDGRIPNLTPFGANSEAKSSLKLSGIGISNESKRSERRVTFSEQPTPSPMMMTARGKSILGKKWDTIAENKENDMDSFTSCASSQTPYSTTNFETALSDISPNISNRNSMAWETALDKSSTRQSLLLSQFQDLKFDARDNDRLSPGNYLERNGRLRKRIHSDDLEVEAMIIKRRRLSVSLGDLRKKRSLSVDVEDSPFIKRRRLLKF